MIETTDVKNIPRSQSCHDFRKSHETIRRLIDIPHSHPRLTQYLASKRSTSMEQTKLNLTCLMHSNGFFNHMDEVDGKHVSEGYDKSLSCKIFENDDRFLDMNGFVTLNFTQEGTTKTMAQKLVNHVRRNVSEANLVLRFKSEESKNSEKLNQLSCLQDLNGVINDQGEINSKAPLWMNRAHHKVTPGSCTIRRQTIDVAVVCRGKTAPLEGNSLSSSRPIRRSESALEFRSIPEELKNSEELNQPSRFQGSNDANNDQDNLKSRAHQWMNSVHQKVTCGGGIFRRQLYDLALERREKRAIVGRNSQTRRSSHSGQSECACGDQYNYNNDISSNDSCEAQWTQKMKRSFSGVGLFFPSGQVDDHLSHGKIVSDAPFCGIEVDCDTDETTTSNEVYDGWYIES